MTSSAFEDLISFTSFVKRPWTREPGASCSGLFDLLPFMGLHKFLLIVRWELENLYPFKTDHADKKIVDFIIYYARRQSSISPHFLPLFSYIAEVGNRVLAYRKKLRRMTQFYSCSQEFIVKNLNTASARHQNARLWHSRTGPELESDPKDLADPVIVSSYWKTYNRTQKRWIFDITMEEFHECQNIPANANYDRDVHCRLIQNLFGGDTNDCLGIIMSFAFCWRMANVCRGFLPLDKEDLVQFVSVDKVEFSKPIDPTPFFEEVAVGQLMESKSNFETERRRWLTPSTLVHLNLKFGSAATPLMIRLPLFFAENLFGLVSDFRIQLETAISDYKMIESAGMSIANIKPKKAIRKRMTCNDDPSGKSLVIVNKRDGRQEWLLTSSIRFVCRRPIPEHSSITEPMSPIPFPLTVESIKLSFNGNLLCVDSQILRSMTDAWVEKKTEEFNKLAEKVHMRGIPFEDDNFFELDLDVYPSKNDVPWCVIFKCTGKSPKKYINVFK